MTVQVYQNSDGSYEWVEGTYTIADVDAANQSGDSITWIQANAQVVPRPAK